MKYKPIDKGRMYSCLLVISWLTILSCTVLKLFGSNAFVLPEFTYNINIWIIRLINLITYEINSMFYLLILIKRKPTKTEILVTLFLSLIPFGLSLFIVTYNYKMIAELIVYILLAILFIKDKWYKPIIEAVTIAVIFIAYQFFTFIYKEINVNIIVDNIVLELVLSIDLYILLTLTTLNSMKKGGYIYDRGLRFLVVLSKYGFSKKNVRKDQKCIQGQEVEFGFKLFIVMLSVFQIVLVGTICYFINHTLIEYIVICLSFFFLRKVFGKSYHSKSVISCTTLAILVFVSATRLTLPASISILCSVLIGCLVAYMMFVMYHFIRYTTAQGITIMRGMDKEALKEICVVNNLSPVEEGILIDFYCNRWKIPKIAMKYGYSVDSINKKKAEILKKIKM